MSNFNFATEFVEQNTINSNRIYGTAIFDRGAVEIIDYSEFRVEAWVGGLSGKVIEGGGSRRRVEFIQTDSGLKWNCTGNPKNHQIFCKHCVALALYIEQNKENLT
jgi:uncharacterized Zn finger protein